MERGLPQSKRPEQRPAFYGTFLIRGRVAEFESASGSIGGRGFYLRKIQLNGFCASEN
jgi:hypothetical protein